VLKDISNFNKGQDLLYKLHVSEKMRSEEGYCNEQKVQECIKCFEDAIKENNMIPCSNLNLARISICLGNYDKAEYYLKNVEDLYQQDKTCGDVDYMKFVPYYRGVIKLLQKGKQDAEVTKLFAEAKQKDLNSYLPDGFDKNDPVLINYEHEDKCKSIHRLGSQRPSV